MRTYGDYEESQFAPRLKPTRDRFSQIDDRTPQDVRESIEARLDRIEARDYAGELDHERAQS